MQSSNGDRIAFEWHQGLVHILCHVIVLIIKYLELFNVKSRGSFQPKLRVGKWVRHANETSVSRLAAGLLHAMRRKWGHRWNDLWCWAPKGHETLHWSIASHAATLNSPRKVEPKFSLNCWLLKPGLHQGTTCPCTMRIDELKMSSDWKSMKQLDVLLQNPELSTKSLIVINCANVFSADKAARVAASVTVNLSIFELASCSIAAGDEQNWDKWTPCRTRVL